MQWALALELQLEYEGVHFISLSSVSMSSSPLSTAAQRWPASA